MKVTKYDYLKLLLLNSWFIFVWGCGGSNLFEEGQYSSTSNDASFSVPFRIPGEDSATLAQAPAAAVVEDDISQPAPSIIYSLDRIEKANRPATLMEYHNMAENRCDDAVCDSIRNMKYMQCNRQNAYLENEMTALTKKNSLLGRIMKADLNPQAIIKPACMRMSMEAKFSPTSSTFRQCNSQGAMSRAIRPCISENYFKLVTNSFDIVSSCMMDYMGPNESIAEQKLDVRAAYAMINIESGFHVNAMSGTGAGGIGQLTANAITDTNNTEMKKVRFALEGHADPVCRQISHEFLDSAQPMRPAKGNSCDRVSISKGNPLLNMVYTYAYMKWSKNAIDRTIFKLKKYEDKFALSKYDMQRVKRAMMVWSHNTGPAGTSTPAMTLLNTVYRGNKKVTNADKFIDELQQYMKRFPARANRSNARRSETSKYFPAITNLLNKVETNVGGGSCVN